MAAAAVAFLAGRRTDALTLRGQLQAVEAQAMLDAALQQTVVLLANRQPRQVVPATAQLAVRRGRGPGPVRAGDRQDRSQCRRGSDAARPAAGARPRRGPRRRVGGRDPGLARRQSAQARARGRGPRLSRRSDRGRQVRRTGRSPIRPSCSTCRRSTRPRGRCSSPTSPIYSGAAAPDARQAAGPVREAIEIARGLQKDEPEDGLKRAGGDQTDDAGGSASAGASASEHGRRRAEGPAGGWRAPCRSPMTGGERDESSRQ